MSEEYLQNILNNQNLSLQDVLILNNWRFSIQDILSKLDGNPVFYCAGSLGKKTIIKEKYDLDIVVYWPNSATYTIKNIFDGVGIQLKKKFKYVNQKTVSWEIPFDSGFHIDVVPGRAIDIAYKEANLYRTDTGTTLKTSIKTHIDTVRNSNRCEAIRLMKLWRERKKVPFKKSFLLEMMTIDGSKGISNLPKQVWNALQYIRDNIETVQIKDPANSNNSLSDDISVSDKRIIKNMAQLTLSAKDWTEIF